MSKSESVKTVSYHILIIVMSAVIALSLPYTGKFIADNYLTYWALIETEDISHLRGSCGCVVSHPVFQLFGEGLERQKVIPRWPSTKWALSLWHGRKVFGRRNGSRSSRKNMAPRGTCC